MFVIYNLTDKEYLHYYSPKNMHQCDWHSKCFICFSSEIMAQSIIEALEEELLVEPDTLCIKKIAVTF